MSKSQIQVELRDKENKLGNIYTKFSKMFLLLTILFIIIILMVFLGIFVFGAGHNWAAISMDTWLIIINVLILIFILLNIIFYFHFSLLKKKRIELEKPKPEFINGKRVYIYTFPTGIEGGIFSKTYIEIDNHSVLRLRTLIIPPNEIL